MHNASKRNKKKIVAFGLAGIILLGTVLYSGILHAPFVFDDHGFIIEDESIRSIKESFKNISNNRYMPSISFALSYFLAGLSPFGYHLVNNLIHVINAMLVYYFIVLTFRTPLMAGLKGSAQFVAFSSAFIFVAHPIQTQAVTYIVQRATSMAALFYLLSVVMYIKWRLGQTTAAEVKPGKRFPTMIFYFFSLVSAVFAMKSKEIAFTLPMIIILYEFFFFSKSASPSSRTQLAKRLIYLIPILLTVLIIPINMLNVQSSAGETITQDIDLVSKETPNIGRIDYLLTEFRVIITYLRLLVFPIGQSLDYRYPLYNSFFNPQVFFSFLCLLGIFCIGIYLFYRSHPPVNGSRFFDLRLPAFGIFWFFITLSVESSIIPIRDVIVEHRLYLPSIGFFVALVTLLTRFISKINIRIAVIVIIVGLLSIAAYNRNTIWKDPQLLWEDVIAKAPNNARAYNNLGVELKNKGKFDKAIEQLEKSLKADKNYTSVYFNLGDVQYRLGNYEDAVVYLKKALTLKLNPQLHLDVLNKLGRTYSAMGQTTNAIETFKEAIRLFPGSMPPYNNLGVQYVKIGKFDLAIETLENALKIKNESNIRSNLSIVYDRKNERDKNNMRAKKK